MFNAWENCEFPSNENAFYGEDSMCYENDLKATQQQVIGHGSIYGRMPINEPSVNFNNGRFYNAQPNFAANLSGYNAYQQHQQLNFQPGYVAQQQQQQPPPSVNYMQPNMLQMSAPCRSNQPWSYDYCYGYAPNNPEPCQFTQFVDIEDFM
ncbi:CG31031 [Drosophila busckii]|uniref:CG31031 n=1 Tax=Drosophila busckii TaxID=30019 RepID=A0A0M4ENH7_DROBS|nr:CG31031 [Drosophila busckii]